MAEPTALELETLTYTILGEARGEGVDGMSMVANVIRNRAESGLFPSSPYDVAMQGEGTQFDPAVVEAFFRHAGDIAAIRERWKG